MDDKKNIVVIIPARGGSKGIPNKNIIDCVGKMFNKKLDTKSIDLYSHERKFFGPF